MATIEAVAPRQYVRGPQRGPITRLLEDERWLATCLMLPTVVLLSLFIAYPFVNGILLAVTDTKVGVPGHFVGMDNFTKIWSDDIFRVAVWNTCLYTFVTTIFKLALGLWLALLLNRHFKGKAFMRAFILLPFIIPTVLSTFAWKWMFDPTFSVINWVVLHLGLLSAQGLSLISSFFANFPHLSAVGIEPNVKALFGATRTNWLGDPGLAMVSVIIVNVWRGVPFYAISLLAGLQTISPELHEAAAIDGARAWARFRHITWPLLLPVTLVIVLFSVIQTFADFQLVYVLTGGGPANATQLFATYAYQLGIGTGLLSQGAAISLAIFPILLLVVIVQLVYIRKAETL
jgi:multiple sugar transport system permease protein